MTLPQTSRTPHRPARRARLQTLLLAGVAFSSLAGCQLINDANEERRAEVAQDKAGRIAMVLGDEALTASSELAEIEVALPEARAVTSWPQTGGSADKNPGHVIAAPELNVAWSVQAGEGSSQKAALTVSPVTSESAVFVLDAEQTVHAFDINSGRKLWSQTVRSGSRRDRVVNGGGLAFGDGRVFVASGFGQVRAIDAQTGDEIWTRDFPNPVVGSPTLREGRLFVVTNNNEIYALSQADGATEWTDQGLSESARVMSSPSAAAIEDIVVVPFSSGEVITYLAANGRRLWTDSLTRTGRFTPISAINDIASRPVLAGGLVFAASQSGVLTAIDGRSGNRVWVQPFATINPPALAGQFLFSVGLDGQAIALQADTGNVIWTRELPGFRNPEKKKDKITYAGPIVGSGRLLLVSSRGVLLALSPQNGEEVGRLDLKRTVFLEPVVAQGMLFVLADDGRLIALR
jgi:outer membrane protein assembly factor BamB